MMNTPICRCFLFFILLAFMLIRPAPCAAAGEERPSEKVWRLAYLEGGPFSDYQQIGRASCRERVFYSV